MVAPPQFVILAAGLGSRLGKLHPKCLTILTTGETILGRQLRLIQEFNSQSNIAVVVGFKEDEVREAALASAPQTQFIVNPDYSTTNTSKSLLKAFMSFSEPCGVVWLNGDVVFSETVLSELFNNMHGSTVGTTTTRVAEEEIKYTLTEQGTINALAKTVPVSDAIGEAVGVNFVQEADFGTLTEALKKVDNQDYFEKAMELTISDRNITWHPFNLTELSLTAVEVDFEEDLAVANKSLES
jgi:choline kinase